MLSKKDRSNLTQFPSNSFLQLAFETVQVTRLTVPWLLAYLSYSVTKTLQVCSWDNTQNIKTINTEESGRPTFVIIEIYLSNRFSHLFVVLFPDGSRK